MINAFIKNKSRLRRHLRVRVKVKGTAQRPRLNVFRSLKHIYAQLIDDDSAETLVSSSSLEKDFDARGNNKQGARKVGERLSVRALEKGITQAVFDRGGYLFHGRVKELAEGARANGLKF
jgi:large subunit ribosomal protein L18